MRVYKTDGIIIKRTNYGEADRILTVFTKRYGKIKVLAKGVRRITSRRAGNVELLNYTSFTFHEGRNFDILTEAKVLESFPKLRKNLKKIAWAYHICELIDAFCPEREESKKILNLTLNTLSSINDKEENLESIVENFENFLLQELGFWPKNKDIPRGKSQEFIERILEKKLKSKKFLEKIR